MSGFVVHKEVKMWDSYDHWDVRTHRELDFDVLCSVLTRYCIGTPMLLDEKIGTGLTALALQYEKKNIEDIYLLHSDDIARLSKVWPFGDFDKDIGYFLWDSGDIIGFPDEMNENRQKNFNDYRMFIWNT